MFGKKKDIMLYGATLVTGLPVPEGVTVGVYMNDEKMQFVISKDQKFDLSLDKVSDVRYYSEDEIEKVVSQSTPGMILGAATFGIVGAMVGGKVKTKDKKVTNHYVLIKYDDKEIMLKTPDSINTIKFQDFFRKLKPVQQTVVTL